MNIHYALVFALVLLSGASYALELTSKSTVPFKLGPAIKSDQPSKIAAIPNLVYTSDDAGDRNFVVEAMMTLLGRRPKSADELEVLTDIIKKTGRESVTRLLMNEDEFLMHWSDVLLRLVRVQQTGHRFQFQECFGSPLRVYPDGRPIRDAGTLAAKIRDTHPAQQNDMQVGIALPNIDFNAVDVAISGLQLDSVWPLLKVHSLSLVQRSNDSKDNTPEVRAARREDIGRAYFSSLLNRNPDCMVCHQSNLSVTGADSGWNRHFPIPYDLEHALLGSVLNAITATQPYALQGMFAAFRKDAVRLPPEPGVDATLNEIDTSGFRPWGLSAECGTYNMTGMYGPIEYAYLAGETGDPFESLSSFDLLDILQEGANTIEAAYGYEGMLTGAPANPNLLWALPTLLESGNVIAYLMALNLVDRIWQEIFGARLTLDHGFPRNPAQRNILQSLADTFLANGGSVKSVLLDIMSGSYAHYFNRVAPKNSLLISANVLPPVYNPWLVADGQVCPEGSGCSNHKGHQVHKYATWTQLRAVSSALDWKGPSRRFTNYPQDDTGGYPNLSLLSDLGAYLSDESPGNSTIGFQELLAWESDFGACEDSGKRNQTSDWVDRLLAAIDGFSADTTDGPLTLEDVILVMKDRLISAPYFDSIVVPGQKVFNSTPDTAVFAGQSIWEPVNEEKELLQVFFEAPLDSDAKALLQSNEDDFEEQLREYCGVLLKSPQAMLANLGLPRVDRVHRIKVCNPGEPCSYTAWCNRYVDHLEETEGVELQCHARNVSVILDEKVL